MALPNPPRPFASHNIPETEANFSYSSYARGEWKFISCHRLLHPNKPHEFRDDLESVFHVLHYIAFRYQPSSLPFPWLSIVMEDIYDDSRNAFSTSDGTESIGGHGKRALFRNYSRLEYDVAETSFCSPLARVLSNLRGIFSDLYTLPKRKSAEDAPKWLLEEERADWYKRQEELEYYFERAMRRTETATELRSIFEWSVAPGGWSDQVLKDRLAPASIPDVRRLRDMDLDAVEGFGDVYAGVKQGARLLPGSY